MLKVVLDVRTIIHGMQMMRVPFRKRKQDLGGLVTKEIEEPKWFLFR